MADEDLSVAETLGEILSSLARIELRLGTLEERQMPDTISDHLEFISHVVSEIDNGNFSQSLIESFGTDLLDTDSKIEDAKLAILKKLADLPLEIDMFKS